MLRKIFGRSAGLGLIEYLLLVALMLIVGVGVLAAFFPSIALMLQDVVNGL